MERGQWRVSVRMLAAGPHWTSCTTYFEQQANASITDKFQSRIQEKAREL